MRGFSLSFMGSIGIKCRYSGLFGKHFICCLFAEPSKNNTQEAIEQILETPTLMSL